MLPVERRSVAIYDLPTFRKRKERRLPDVITDVASCGTDWSCCSTNTS
jgi:hypothetical protein